MHDDEYADETFEEEDEAQPLAEVHELKAISFDEVELGEQLSGGGVGLIYCGRYRGERVAVKTLVRFRQSLRAIGLSSQRHVILIVSMCSLSRR